MRASYIGIGRLLRPGAGHTPDVDRLLAHPDTIIEVLDRPYSTWADAKRAETFALAVARATGPHTWLNCSEMKASSSSLVPWLPRTAGTLRYDDLRETVILVIRPDRIDDRRGTVTGATDDLAVAERVLQWWPTGAAIERGNPIARCLTLTKSTKNLGARVVGDWDTLEIGEWPLDGRVGVADPTDRNPRGTVGMRFDWCGARPGNLISYSGDLRKRNAAA